MNVAAAPTVAVPSTLPKEKAIVANVATAHTTTPRLFSELWYRFGIPHRSSDSFPVAVDGPLKAAGATLGGAIDAAKAAAQERIFADTQGVFEDTASGAFYIGSVHTIDIDPQDASSGAPGFIKRVKSTLEFEQVDPSLRALVGKERVVDFTTGDVKFTDVVNY